MCKSKTDFEWTEVPPVKRLYWWRLTYQPASELEAPYTRVGTCVTVGSRSPSYRFYTEPSGKYMLIVGNRMGRSKYQIVKLKWPFLKRRVKWAASNIANLLPNRK